MKRRTVAANQSRAVVGPAPVSAAIQYVGERQSVDMREGFEVGQDDVFVELVNRRIDGPEFHDLADKERREAIKKEGRNPDEAIKKMDSFSHPDNKALEEDPKKETPK